MSRESWNQTEWRYDPVTGENGWVELEQPPVTGNVQVEFPWGNVPMQPDTDRVVETVTTTGNEDFGWSPVTQVTSATLNLALDNHSTTYTRWNGYPDYMPNQDDEYEGTYLVPDVVGLNSGEAWNVLHNAGFNTYYVTLVNVDGATAENHGTVKSISPAAGKTINYGDTITVTDYYYTPPEVQVFAWNLADWQMYAMGITSFYTYDGWFSPGQLGLITAMRASNPSPATNGWQNLYVRCTGVMLYGSGDYITIADGDYLITTSRTYLSGDDGVFLDVDFSYGWSGPSSYEYSFYSGNIAIIQK